MSDLILVLNCCSSTITFALFDADAQPLPRQPLWNGKVDGITGPAPTFGETGVTPGPVTLDAAHPYHAALQHIRSRVLAAWQRAQQRQGHNNAALHGQAL